MNYIAKILFLLFLIVNTKTFVFAQDSQEQIDTFIVVEQLPVLLFEDKEYQLKDIQILFGQLAQQYEFSDTSADCSGRVVVSFYIEEDGTLSNLKLVRKVCPEIDEKTLEIFRKMKTWKPAMNNGKLIRFNLSLAFYWNVK